MASKRKEGEIEIIAHVRPCPGGGFIPMITVNGREHWNWRRVGDDRRKAVSAAVKLAKEEAAQFVGDWKVTIKNHTAVRRR